MADPRKRPETSAREPLPADPRRLLSELFSLALVLGAALGALFLDGRGLPAGTASLSPALLLLLGAWHQRRFKVALPLGLKPRSTRLTLSISIALPALLALSVPLCFTEPYAFPSGWEMAQLMVLAPVAEEYYFRGLLLDHLRRGWGSVRAVTICSLLFAWLHVQAGAAHVAFILSLATCLLTIRGGSLAYAVQLHVAWNAFSLLQRAAEPAARWSCVAIGSAAIVLLGVVSYLRDRHDGIRSEDALPSS